MEDFFKDYVLEISHSYNKENNYLLSVTRIYSINGIDCNEKYTVIDLNTMNKVETTFELISTTYWEEISWEEIDNVDDIENKLIIPIYKRGNGELILKIKER